MGLALFQISTEVRNYQKMFLNIIYEIVAIVIIIRLIYERKNGFLTDLSVWKITLNVFQMPAPFYTNTQEGNSKHKKLKFPVLDILYL